MTRGAWLSFCSFLCIALGAPACESPQPADVGAVDAPTSDVPGLDAPRDTSGADVPGLDAPGVDGGTGTSRCARLPAPSGTIVAVDPSMAAALPAMVRDAAANTTFVLADGTYRMSGDEASRRLQIRAPGVTLRSASGDAAAVIIDGEYGTNEIITVHANDVTLAEITVTHAVDHCVHVTPPTGSVSITGFSAYGVRIQDCGEQFIKINPNGDRAAFADDGAIACSHFELTDAGRPHVERAVGGCYTGGIDAHGARGWVVRDSTFVDIYCETEGLAEHAIHFWTGSRDTVIERNQILNCARGIGLGLVESGATRSYPDDPHPGLFVGHYDGIVRNNVILADVPFYDTGIELDQARGALVVHNTIIETAAATGSFSSIDTRFDNSITTVRNNLVRRITVRSGSSTADHNVENVPLSYFVDGAAGDAHLTASATDAIDRGVAIPECPTDAEGMSRVGPPDLGAYERR